VKAARVESMVRQEAVAEHVTRRVLPPRAEARLTCGHVVVICGEGDDCARDEAMR